MKKLFFAILFSLCICAANADENENENRGRGRGHDDDVASAIPETSTVAALGFASAIVGYTIYRRTKQN